MKTKVLYRLITMCILLFSINITAQTETWNNEITDDGKVTVQSIISERTNEKNDVVDVVEYIATTNTEVVSMQSFISVMKNVKNHEEILDCKKSKLLKTISETEWIVYYYFDFPWPMPNADCVVRMNLSEDSTKQEAIFSLTATHYLYPNMDVDRMTYYNVDYKFKDYQNGKGEMSIDSKISATVQAPKFLVNLWFPEGPAELLRRIIKLASVTEESS